MYRVYTHNRPVQAADDLPDAIRLIEAHFGVEAEDLWTEDSCDGSTSYWYLTEAEAQADTTGSYAPCIEVLR